jgi:hypothetical protein
MNNEDQIIADAFLTLRQGILEGNWQLVCDAYEAVSGERIALEKPKTRLEKIREAMNLDTEEVQAEPEEKVISIESMTVKELKTYLLGVGIKEKDLKNKNKSQLLDLLPQTSVSEPVVKTINEDEIKGGDRFGRGTVKIISDGFDPIEAGLNKKAAEKKTKLPASVRSAPIKDNSEDDSAEFRFYNKPKMAPPWR